jgi:hypothetical protein
MGQISALLNYVHCIARPHGKAEAIWIFPDTAARRSYTDFCYEKFSQGYKPGKISQKLKLLSFVPDYQQGSESKTSHATKILLNHHGKSPDLRTVDSH